MFERTFQQFTLTCPLLPPKSRIFSSRTLNAEADQPLRQEVNVRQRDAPPGALVLCGLTRLTERTHVREPQSKALRHI